MNFIKTRHSTYSFAYSCASWVPTVRESGLSPRCVELRIFFEDQLGKKIKHALSNQRGAWIEVPNSLILKITAGAFAKLKRGHVKRYAASLSVSGALRSRVCSGPRAYLIRPWMHPRSRHWHQMDHIVGLSGQLNNVTHTRIVNSPHCTTDRTLVRSKLLIVPRNFFAKVQYNSLQWH